MRATGDPSPSRYPARDDSPRTTTAAVPMHAELRPRARVPSPRHDAIRRRSSCPDAVPLVAAQARRPRVPVVPDATRPKRRPSSRYAEPRHRSQAPAVRRTAVSQSSARPWALARLRRRVLRPASCSGRAIRHSIGTSRPRLESVPRRMDRVSRRIDLSTRSNATSHRSHEQTRRFSPRWPSLALIGRGRPARTLDAAETGTARNVEPSP
jgi:hypothetical protein